MDRCSKIFLSASLFLSLALTQTVFSEGMNMSPKSVYDFSVQTIDGQVVSQSQEKRAFIAGRR